jgi:hypothetical protein
MNRRVFFLGLAVSALAVALLLTYRLLQHPGITEANVRRIRPGMSVQEVEAFLGGPSNSDLETAGRLKRLTELAAKADRMAANLDSAAVLSGDGCSRAPRSEPVLGLDFIPSWPISRICKGDRGRATVQFDQNDRVESARFEPSRQSRFLRWVRWWLGQ